MGGDKKSPLTLYEAFSFFLFFFCSEYATSNSTWHFRCSSNTLLGYNIHQLWFSKETVYLLIPQDSTLSWQGEKLTMCMSGGQYLDGMLRPTSKYKGRAHVQAQRARLDFLKLLIIY